MNTTPFMQIDELPENGRVLPVVRKTRLAELAGTYDLILIASAWWREIAAGLNRDGVADVAAASPVLWHKYIYSKEEMEKAKASLDAVENMLASDEDKAVYRFMVNARLENSPLVNTDAISPQIVDYLHIRQTLFSHLTGQYLDFVVRKPVETIFHAGVFDGTDCLNFLQIFPNLKAIHGFEPQGEERIRPDTLARLRDSGKVHIHAKGLWSSSQVFPLTGRGSHTAIDPEASPHKTTGSIETVSIDEFVAARFVEKVDYICLDVERAEQRVLDGARKTIAEHRPQLAVCIYHRKEDIFRLPLSMNDMLDNYVFHIGHYFNFLNETVLYALPQELVD